MNFNSYFTIKHTSNLRILLLTLFFIVPLGTIYGQNQLITIAGKNITLLKAFDAIESQTQLSITYSRTKIDVNRTLSVDFKKQKLSIVLDKLLAGTGFTYKIEKGYIVLVPVPVKQEQTEATSKKIQGVIGDGRCFPHLFQKDQTDQWNPMGRDRSGLRKSFGIFVLFL